MGRSAADGLSTGRHRTRTRSAPRKLPRRRHPADPARRTDRARASLGSGAGDVSAGSRRPDPRIAGRIQIGGEVIPAPRTSRDAAPLRVLYSREPLPRVSLKDLVENPRTCRALCGQGRLRRGHVHTATYDRVATPYGQGRIPGVEVHAQLFETLERGKFLTDASNLAVLGFSVAAAYWPADLRASLGLAGLSRPACCWSPCTATPFLVFRQSIVFPFFAPLASAWLRQSPLPAISTL